MFEKILFPLLLTERQKEVYGRTRFQKMMFLAQKAVEKNGTPGPGFRYKIYLHGPFSFELTGAIEELVNDGLMEEGVEPTREGYQVFVYRLTDKGTSFVQEALGRGLIEEKQLDAISGTVKKYGKWKLDPLIDEAYKEFGVVRPKNS
jgi:uncharacterized protein YwgA